ncbi:MAG: hypothetical protein Q8N98_02570 [bacterium]|nr:hypothetical protein [bacterium]
MERSREEKIADLFKMLQPDLEKKEFFFLELPIGSRFWIPCAGMASCNIKLGHVGRVQTYAGDRRFTYGDWISKKRPEKKELL